MVSSLLDGLSVFLRRTKCQLQTENEEEGEKERGREDVWGCVGMCGDVWGCVGMCGDVWPTRRIERVVSAST